MKMARVDTKEVNLMVKQVLKNSQIASDNDKL